MYPLAPIVIGLAALLAGVALFIRDKEE